MIGWLWCIVVVVAGLVGGCASGSSSAPSVPMAPSEADGFFADTKVAALARALERSDWAGAEKALRAGADLNAVGKDAITLPTWTMYVRNKKAFEWLYEHGANPNLDPGWGRGAMTLAVRADDPDWLRILLSHKANPNLIHKDSIGATTTPLTELALERRLTNLKMLIAAGADVNYQLPDDDAGVTAAICAAQLGWFEGTYVLLEAGAEIRPRTARGADLTYHVVRRNSSNDLKDPFREKVLQFLRDRGADIEGAMKEVSDEEAEDRRENPWRYR